MSEPPDSDLLRAFQEGLAAELADPLAHLAHWLGFVGSTAAADAEAGMLFSAEIFQAYSGERASALAAVDAAAEAIGLVWRSSGDETEAGALPAAGALPEVAAHVAQSLRRHVPEAHALGAPRFTRLAWDIVAALAFVHVERELRRELRSLISGEMLASDVRALARGFVHLEILRRFAAGEARTVAAGRRHDRAMREALICRVMVALASQNLGARVTTYGEGPVLALASELAPLVGLPPLPGDERHRRAILQRIFRRAGIATKAGRRRSR